LFARSLYLQVIHRVALVFLYTLYVLHRAIVFYVNPERLRLYCTSGR